MSVVEALEGLVEGLVGHLGEGLPGLQEAGHVLHLPPEVERLEVDGGHGLVLAVAEDGVVLDRGREYHLGRRVSGEVEDGVDRAVDADGGGAGLAYVVLRVSEVLGDEVVGVAAGVDLGEEFVD